MVEKKDGILVLEGTVTTGAKYDFTKEEIEKKATELAKTVNEKNDIEEEKKQDMKDYNARLGEKQKTINKLSRDIEDGFEHRPIECTVEKDFGKGVKRYKAVLSKKVVKEEKLTSEDHQVNIDDKEKD